MKHLLAICAVLIISLASFGQSIPIDSFFTPGATWTQAAFFDSRTGSGTARSWGADKIICKIERDSIISGTKYHLLSLSKTDQYHYSWHHISPTKFGWGKRNYYSNIIGRIRVAGSQVYFTRDSDNGTDYKYSSYALGVEYLLYNFAISSIDSVFMSNGYPIKKYNYPDSYWLEGIGNSLGLIDYGALTSGPGSWVIDSEKLLCYDHPSFSYHLSFTTDIMPGNLENNCFDIETLGIQNINASSNDILVYPNPVSGNLLMLRSSTPDEILSFHIFDITGKSLFTYPFVKSVSSDIQILMPDEKGMYLLETEFTDHTKCTKIVVKE
ncbi:MAG: hypothetical protein K0Q79_3583 [Flavipsychrobacter sp.]|jgi:hypothetical protein|nr:hypothetical protein [Flavipsychrobacter sp.]